MIKTSYNTGLAKVAVQSYVDAFVVIIATFAKPETVIGKFNRHSVMTQTREPPKDNFHSP